MKKIIATLAFASALFATAFAQDATGRWKLDDGSAIVEVYHNGDCYNGRIVWLENPTDNGKPVTDSKNPDEKLRSREIMGLNMLSGLKKDGAEYRGGTIYDPGNGKTYNCSMKLEGDVLKVRGSLDKRGLLGRTMDWFRVK